MTGFGSLLLLQSLMLTLFQSLNLYNYNYYNQTYQVKLGQKEEEIKRIQETLRLVRTFNVDL